jgi:hypothetical protein
VTLALGALTLLTTFPFASITNSGGIPTEYPPNVLNGSALIIAQVLYHLIIFIKYILTKP